MGGRRSPVALSQVVSADLRDRVRISVVLGAAAAIIAWIFTSSFSLDDAPTIGGAATGAVAFSVVALIAFAVPSLGDARRRRATEIVFWVAQRSAERSQTAIGEARIPATPAQAVSWLDRHPDTDATRSLRLFCQLVVGNLTEARRLLERLPAAEPQQQVTRAASAALVRIVEGDPPDVSELRRLATELDGDDALGAEIDAAMVEALAAAADGRDWMAPMLALESRIGPAARGSLIRPVWLPVAIYLAAGGLLLGLGWYGIRLLLG